MLHTQRATVMDRAPVLKRQVEEAWRRIELEGHWAGTATCTGPGKLQLVHGKQRRKKPRGSDLGTKGNLAGQICARSRDREAAQV